MFPFIGWKSLSLSQLKFLATKHNVKVRGRIEEGFWEDTRLPPSKAQYVRALAKVVSDKDIESAKTQVVKVKKKRHRQDDSWF